MFVWHCIVGPRFGTALAKVRTKYGKSIRRRALKFLREAKKSRNSNQYNKSSRVNRAWMAGANLQPVLDFMVNNWWPFRGFCAWVPCANQFQFNVWWRDPLWKSRRAKRRKSIIVHKLVWFYCRWLEWSLSWKLIQNLVRKVPLKKGSYIKVSIFGKYL